MLYFKAGIPARAVLRIMVQIPSISRSRSGLRPSMRFGFSARAIGCELRGRGTMSSRMPNDSTRSRSFVRPSTVQRSSRRADGSVLQMSFTPRAASTARVASEESCCVPTFMSARLRAGTDAGGAGAACVADPSVAAAPRAAPPASCPNLLRSMAAEHTP
jgi:hypothetical protein